MVKLFYFYKWIKNAIVILDYWSMTLRRTTNQEPWRIIYWVIKMNFKNYKDHYNRSCLLSRKARYCVCVNYISWSAVENDKYGYLKSYYTEIFNWYFFQLLITFRALWYFLWIREADHSQLNDVEKRRDKWAVCNSFPGAPRDTDPV